MRHKENSYWTAFYTKPRNEKKAAQRLANRGFEVYCPTRSVLKQWSDRKKRIQEPIFTSYLFVRVTDLERIEVLMDAAIISNVTWLGKPAIIKQSEIEAIKSFINEYPDVELASKGLKSGDEVLVDAGALTGQNGSISRIKGNKAYLSLTSLGLELYAEVPLVHLRKVD